MKHEAFLSYARAPDLALATALERSLQAFAKPWNRVRAIDVFRDQTDLSSIRRSGPWSDLRDRRVRVPDPAGLSRVGEVALGYP